MLTCHLDVTYTIVRSIAVSNILSAGICLLFTNQIATIRANLLAPLIIVVVVLAASRPHATEVVPENWTGW